MNFDSIRRRLRWKHNSLNFEKLSEKHPLEYLFLEVTRRCNLKCVYCGSECSAETSRAELPVSTWINIMRQIAEDFSPKNVMVAVTGGEPLLKEGIGDLFFEINRLRFPFGMVSNGTLINQANAVKIAESGMGAVSLSLDGLPEANDSLRGKGVAEKVGQAINNLRAAGYNGKLEIITTLTRPAIPQLDEIRQYLANLRISSWRVVPVMPIGRAASRPDLIPLPDDIRAALDFVKKARADGYMPAPEFGEEGYLGDDYEGEVRPFLFQCRAGLTTGGILHDGRIGACPELSDSFTQGNISTDRFMEVWENRYEVFRDRSWTCRAACASCEAYTRCKGGSLHLYPAPDQDFLRCYYLMLKTPNVL